MSRDTVIKYPTASRFKSLYNHMIYVFPHSCIQSYLWKAEKQDFLEKSQTVSDKLVITTKLGPYPNLIETNHWFSNVLF